MKEKLYKLLHRLMQVEQLYLKFILTVIAVALLFIALELNDNLPLITDALWRISRVF